MLRCKQIRKPIIIIIEQLQAFASDWITLNLYVVFRNHRRILVCSSNYTDTDGNMTGNNGCADLFKLESSCF